MRKLKLQMQISLDGFAAAGPNDEQNWITWALEDIYSHVLSLLDSMDTILLGRKLAVDYIPYWEETLTRPADPMHAFAVRIVAARKIIFTKTLQSSKWNNTLLATGDLVDQVKKLKAESGKDLMVYGGCSFVAALIREGLIDEFHFFVNPVALGNGIGVFSELKGLQPLRLKQSVAYPSGLVLLVYEKA